MPFWAPFLFEVDAVVWVMGLGCSETEVGALSLDMGKISNTDVLGDWRRGLLDSCFVLNASDFIRELLGSLFGQLYRFHFGVGLRVLLLSVSRLL